MHEGRLVFSQLPDFLPMHDFSKCVRRYDGNYKVRDFSCTSQFLCMAYAQLTGRVSLRDIETCLRTMGPKLYHAGIRGRVSRSTLADANKHRDWRIFADFAHILIKRARSLYAADSFGVDLKAAAYALDSTTIDLCMTLFPWARFRRHKAGIKMHTLIDLKGSIPSFLCITDARTHDVNFLDQVPLEPGAFYIMDRGYLDFERLFTMSSAGCFFVTRARKDLDYVRTAYRRVDKTTGLRSDQTITLAGFLSHKHYPSVLRRISYHDTETDKRFVFLTNCFDLPALTIAQLYKCRWKIELFFKWIKQHLHIKAFFGTSENAVKTQIWIAVTVYVLVAIFKQELKLDCEMSEIQQILSVALFEKEPVAQLLTRIRQQNQNTDLHKQLPLFDL